MPYFEVQLTKKLHRIYEVGADTIIGRAPQCAIQLLSRAVSRRHARIEFDGTQAIISDLGTKNGIKLNGHKVQGAAPVSEGDVVLVGDINMRFRAADRSIIPADVIDLRNRPAGPAELQAALGPKATFLLRAHPESLNQFQSTVGRGRIARLDFDELSRFKLQIGLREALDNARLHGCGGDPNRFIHVTLSETDEEFLISVKDEGGGFNVESALAGAAEVDAMEAVRDRPKLGKGLGLRMILNCVDRVQFEGRGSTIHMGRFKDAGMLFVISESSGELDVPVFDESASGDMPLPNQPPPPAAMPGMPGPPPAMPGPPRMPGPPGPPADPVGGGEIELGDLF